MTFPHTVAIGVYLYVEFYSNEISHHVVTPSGNNPSQYLDRYYSSFAGIYSDFMVEDGSLGIYYLKSSLVQFASTDMTVDLDSTPCILLEVLDIIYPSLIPAFRERIESIVPSFWYINAQS